MIKQKVLLLLLISTMVSVNLCQITGKPRQGDRLESTPLILQWNYTFKNFRGCFWNFISNVDKTEVTFISYGTEEGLEINRKGWELLYSSQPCSGGVVKRNSSVTDAGEYQFGIIYKHDKKVYKSEYLPVGIIKTTNRSVHILSDNGETILLPGHHDNTTLYTKKNIKHLVKLNERYPGDTCTVVNTYKQESLFLMREVCKKSFSVVFDDDDDDITHVQLTVPVDTVDYKQFVFTIKVEATDVLQYTVEPLVKETTKYMSWSPKVLAVPFAVLLALCLGIMAVLYQLIRLIKNRPSIPCGVEMPIMPSEDADGSENQRTTNSDVSLI